MRIAITKYFYKLQKKINDYILMKEGKRERSDYLLL